jgi:hypothetical protein
MSVADHLLQITFQTPFRVGSGLGRGLGVDHTAVRNAEGLPYLPGSLLKGCLRSLCKRLALTVPAEFGGDICQTQAKTEVCKPPAGQEPCIICRLFGSRFWAGALRFGNGELDEPWRTAQRLRLAVCPGRLDPWLGQPRHQVRLNRRRGVAQAQFLFCGETLAQDLTFTAKVTLLRELTPVEQGLLDGGVQLLTHLGSQKARGLGQCRLSWKEGTTP